MTVNEALFVDTLAHIEMERETWLQGSWGQANVDPDLLDLGLEPDELAARCGTSHCFAGWALVLAGVKLRWELVPDADGQRPYLKADMTAGGEWIWSAACRELGIEHDAFELQRGGYPRLFDGGNPLSDLYRIAAKNYLHIPQKELRDRVQLRITELSTPKSEAVSATAKEN
jgi:hypothetical protein